ncbi:hypothetical protein GCM10018966_077120 [Streptomyces yanii]
MPAVRAKRGRPRRRPDVVLGDRGYDHEGVPEAVEFELLRQLGLLADGFEDLALFPYDAGL